MPPTLKKWGAYCFQLIRLFVRLSVCLSVQKNFKARVLKFHIWIPHKKIAYPYFYYTPGIYAEGYIVFVFPFVRSYVRMFVRSYFLPSCGICVKVLR